MRRSTLAVFLVLMGALALHRPARLTAAADPDLAGQWTLNRQLSELPREVGFDVEFPTSAGSDQDSPSAGGRGRRGAGVGAFGAPRESEDDAKRVQQLTAAVRSPSTHLRVVESPAAITFTDDQGRSRTFHPNGREDVVQLDGVPVAVVAKWEADRLVVLYKVEEGRAIRYTYSRGASPAQLVVDVQFIEHGAGDKARFVYEPGSAPEPPAAAAASPPPSAPSPGPLARAVASDGQNQALRAAPDDAPGQALDQRPDAELKGLTTIGLVVEDFTSQAAACGLKQDALDAVVAQHLADAGFTVRRNSDEDTYVYVNVITASVSTGLCVSRYDVLLNTHTTARLSYQDRPVLVEVSLLRKGGLAGGNPAAHADGVRRGVLEFVDQFTKRIRDANAPQP